MVIMACSLTLYTTKIRGMKFSPIALLLYWGKIFVKFNFANRVCSTLQKVVDGARAYRIKVVLYSSISHCYRGRRQLTQQGPRKIGQISRCSAKMLEDWLDSRERERELETAVSMQVLAHMLKIIVHEQKNSTCRKFTVGESIRRKNFRHWRPLAKLAKIFSCRNFCRIRYIQVWPLSKMHAWSVMVWEASSLVVLCKINHCLFSLSATMVTTLWLKQPICFCSACKQT